MASYQVKVDLIFGEKGIVRGAHMYIPTAAERPPIASMDADRKAFESKASFLEINKLPNRVTSHSDLVDRFRQMEPLMRPLAPGNAPFWPDSSV